MSENKNRRGKYEQLAYQIIYPLAKLRRGQQTGEVSRLRTHWGVLEISIEENVRQHGVHTVRQFLKVDFVKRLVNNDELETLLANE